MFKLTISRYHPGLATPDSLTRDTITSVGFKSEIRGLSDQLHRFDLAGFQKILLRGSIMFLIMKPYFNLLQCNFIQERFKVVERQRNKVQVTEK